MTPVTLDCIIISYVYPSKGSICKNLSYFIQYKYPFYLTTTTIHILIFTVCFSYMAQPRGMYSVQDEDRLSYVEFDPVPPPSDPQNVHKNRTDKHTYGKTKSPFRWMVSVTDHSCILDCDHSLCYNGNLCILIAGR